MITTSELEASYGAMDRLTSAISETIVGHEQVVRQTLITMLCGGNILLEGVPGLGKTLLVRTIASALSLRFSRIQFTPDLMPADIVGTDIITQDESSRRFTFSPGPIFANLVLADEINRATPKTQSALLEAMEERTVTVGKETYKLEEPFIVLATQNPIEMEGTYPLPEAQLDRFMFNLWVDYPKADEEMEIVRTTTSAQENQLSPVLNGSQITDLQALVRRVPVADNVIQFAVKLARQTRPNSQEAPKMVQDYINWGAGPRASQYLVLGAKTRAILDGRPTPDIEDIKAVAKPVLRHRLVPNFNAEAEGVSATDIIEKLIKGVDQ